MHVPTHVSVKTTVSLILISVLVCSGVLYYVWGAPSSTFWVSPGVYPGAPDFTVWREGNNYFAKTANGEIEYSGTNASEIVNSLIITDELDIYIKNHVILDSPIIIDQANITLYGTLPNSIIDGNGLSTNLIELPNVPSVYGIQICGLEFTNFAGSAIEATTYATLPNSTDIQIYNNRFTNILSASNKHVISTRATHLKITNNYICSTGHYAGYAIYARYANNSVISGNYINGTGAGVTFWDYDGIHGYNNIVSGNIVSNLWNSSDSYWAIYVMSSDSIIENNVVYNTARDAIVCSNWYGSKHCTISGNVVYDCGTGDYGVGIWVHGYTGGSYDNVESVTVTGNTVRNCSHGIVLTHTMNSTVSNNAVSSCRCHGIYLAGSRYCTVIGNTVVGCDSGDLGQYDGIHVWGPNNVIIGNNCLDNDRYDIHLYMEYSYNTVIGCSTRDSDSVVGVFNNGTDNHVNLCWNHTTWIS